MTKKYATSTRPTTDKTYFTESSTGELAKPDSPSLPIPFPTSTAVLPTVSTSTTTSVSTSEIAVPPPATTVVTTADSNVGNVAEPYQQSVNKVVIKRYAIKRD
jgi:hypothetical protein